MSDVGPDGTEPARAPLFGGNDPLFGPAAPPSPAFKPPGNNSSKLPPPPIPRTTALDRIQRPDSDSHRDIAADNGWFFIDLDDPNVVINQEASDLMRAQTARDFNAIPVSIEKRVLLVAVADPDDNTKTERLRPLVPGYTMRFGYANPNAIRRYIERVYSASGEAAAVARAEEARRRSAVGASEEGGDLGRVASATESAAAQMLRLTIEEALRSNASDIHFEPTEYDLDVRIRVDGHLRSINRYPVNMAGTLMRKIKVDAGMRADNFLVPDSGVLRYTPKDGGAIVDIRVEISPTAWGPGGVMRLQQNIWRELSGIGFSGHNEPRIRNALAQPDGILLATGPTGSGKMLQLSTTIPTPIGNTTMGELRRGDWVLGRDGKPCQVTGLSPIVETPNLYRVTFSDGQTVLADHDHQWLVSDHHGRSVPRTRKRLVAIERHNRVHGDADGLDRLARRLDPQDHMTAIELHDMVVGAGLDSEYPSPYTVTDALSVTDCARRFGTRPHSRTDTTVRNQKVTVYPTRDILASIASGRSAHAGHAAALLEQDVPALAGCVEIGSWFGKKKSDLAYDQVARLGLDGLLTTTRSVYERQYNGNLRVVEYPAAEAVTLLATRLRQRFSDAPSSVASLHRLTTGEMLSRGIRLTQGHANFSVPVTSALDLPHADLPVDPYIMGAWLGDGSSGSTIMTQGTTEACQDPVTGETDQAFLMSQFSVQYESAAANHRPDKHFKVLGTFKADLRTAGVWQNKHIPITYLRASAAQRLALLQGLMDTDGTVDVNGNCELSLSDRTLVTDALNLVRSLGIKASISWDRPAGYRDENGDLVECKDRHRIHFTTNQPVFRLPRKLARLPGTVRETQGWLYITDIEPVPADDPDYGPARCISVDSPDHTYLCGDGYVVTSNSTLMYSLVRERIDPTTKIITLENPIEYKVPRGVEQLAVNFEQGMTFSTGLRSILRRDPNVVLVGEIRDRETAETAIDAAMTGHLLLSTLHTNDAPGIVPRLLRMGIEPFLLSSSLLGAVGQRLIRKLCPKCKVPEPFTPDQAIELGLDPELAPKNVFDAHPGGCDACREGWIGRLPIHEVMLVGDELIEAIADNAAQARILQLAREGGMTTMREDGYEKVRNGLTSIPEVISSTRTTLV